MNINTLVLYPTALFFTQRVLYKGASSAIHKGLTVKHNQNVKSKPGKECFYVLIFWISYLQTSSIQ